MAKANMQKKANQNGAAVDEQPVIAWDEISVLDSMALAKRHDETNAIRFLSLKVEQGIATEEDIERIGYLSSEEHIMAFLNWQAEQMAKYVSFVPASWFTKGIKKADIDFDVPETFLSLQTRRFNELWRLLIMTQVQQDSASGN